MESFKYKIKGDYKEGRFIIECVVQQENAEEVKELRKSQRVYKKLMCFKADKTYLLKGMIILLY
jgi:hypothetical protein